jgi:hypothetical protein
LIVNDDLAKLPAHLRQRLEQELKPGERVVYAGRPVLAWENCFLILIPIMLAWTVMPTICLVWMGGGALGFWTLEHTGEFDSIRTEMPRLKAVFMALSAAPFACIGLLIPFNAMRALWTTVHAVTDRRVLTVCLNPVRTDLGRQSFAAEQLTTLQVDSRPNGKTILSIGIGLIRDDEGQEVNGARAVAAVEALMNLPAGVDQQK